jgi:hypothetical protein
VEVDVHPEVAAVLVPGGLLDEVRLAKEDHRLTGAIGDQEVELDALVLDDGRSLREE